MRITALGAAGEVTGSGYLVETRGARVLANPVGTAPGFALKLARAEVSCLPGPPRELERLLRDHVLPRWSALPSRAHVAVRRLHASGISEAALGERIRDWMRPTSGRRFSTTSMRPSSLTRAIIAFITPGGTW